MAEMHKHVLINANLAHPIHDPEVLNDWLVRVVEKIGMNVFIPPQSRYCDTPGNEGITGFVVIDTSHLSIHVWDHPEPHAKADLYSCKDFSVELFIEMFKDFGLLGYEYLVVDRSNHLMVQKYDCDWVRGPSSA